MTLFQIGDRVKVDPTKATRMTAARYLARVGTVVGFPTRGARNNVQVAWDGNRGRVSRCHARLLVPA